ncbi:hypothetical protein LUZ63_002151 [Rhynchospora breviuscula]|uniref:RNase H type-1 domain-containing protein n=1 Tax=Rhynchospora breviuscula TaxID=2022672 RepID=A0A9Q0HXQ9_9POAL|nr:hypothetical protein LUZ63_002151 [Rhynchospora breviuscula]
MLSQAAKLVLLKTVIEPLLLDSMGAGHIPDSILQKINLKMRAFFWNSGEKHKMRLVPWEKITSPKLLGGLGLRDTTILNRAMIMKTIWRLNSGFNDGALWVQVLKAKYLSRSFFWLASAPTRCSKMWRAVLQGREDIQHHVKWIIGDGTGQWDTTKLISALGFQAALFITCTHPTPPLKPSTPDRLIFTPAHSGSFSFKGACHLLQPPSDPNPSRLFNCIWKCPGIFPRIRLFLWKLIHDAVPVKSVFAKYLRIVVPPCEICALGPDDAMHALFLCPKAEQSWLNSSIGLRVHVLPTEIDRLLKALLEQLTQHDFMRFANHLWALWKARCKEVYEGTKINVQQVCSLANSYTFLANVAACRTVLPNQHSQKDQAAHLVPQDGYICRLDGSYHITGAAGWAYSLSEDQQLVQYGLEWGTASSPFHAEAIALLTALRAVSAVGWSFVTFLTDCQVLSNVVRGAVTLDSVDWSAYTILLQIMAIFKQELSFHCCYVPRTLLQHEHQLANYARINKIRAVGFSLPSFPPT